jgi:hypothetical protein
MSGIAKYMQVNQLIGIKKPRIVCHCSRIEFLLVTISGKNIKMLVDVP